jgi:hypothetical protein
MKINIPFNPISATAVTASLAESSSFLNNIGKFINSASLGLNIVGAAGATGTNAVKVGSTGERGDTGDPAPDGLNIYLLSAARATCAGCIAGTIPADFVSYPSTGCPPSWQFNFSTGCCFTELAT